MAEWQIERLDRGHVREGFDCGKPSLDDFLHSLVSQYEKRNLGRTYVALPEGGRRVLGYYTLAGGSITAEELPAKQARLERPRGPALVPELPDGLSRSNEAGCQPAQAGTQE